jgi:hypothetical protein
MTCYWCRWAKKKNEFIFMATSKKKVIITKVVGPFILSCVRWIWVTESCFTLCNFCMLLQSLSWPCLSITDCFGTAVLYHCDLTIEQQIKLKCLKYCFLPAPFNLIFDHTGWCNGNTPGSLFGRCSDLKCDTLYPGRGFSWFVAVPSGLSYEWII